MVRDALCTLESHKPDSVFILISLMPAHFGPPECVVITDRSSVAAGGIVTFHPSPIAVRLQGNDRLCGSLILSVQESPPSSFDKEIPAVTRRSLRSVPHILLSGLSSPTLPSGREFGFQGTHVLYHNPASRKRLGYLDRNFFPNVTLHRFCTFRYRKPGISLSLRVSRFSL
jgi:hypothetical protein